MKNDISRIAKDIIASKYDIDCLYEYIKIHADKRLFDNNEKYYYDYYIAKCICEFVRVYELSYTQKEMNRIIDNCIPDENDTTHFE